MSVPSLDQSIAVLDEALRGTKLAAAWHVVRTAARRNRRISQTLPRVFDLAQHMTLAISRLDTLFTQIGPELYEAASQIRDHLLAMRDALQTTRSREDEETQPRIDLGDT